MKKKEEGFIVLVIILIVLLVSCRNEINDVQNLPDSSYVKVPFIELDSYLANKASKKEVNYIEITHLTEWCLKGNGYYNPSPLATILRQYLEKKVAIRFGDDVTKVKSMVECFKDCRI